MHTRQPHITRRTGTSDLAAIGDAVDAVGVGSGIDLGGTAAATSARPARLPAAGRPAGSNPLVAVFQEPASAALALADLRQAAFRTDQIGLALCSGPVIEQADALATADVADRGLLEVLVQMGVPEDEARAYDRDFQACRPIVTVTAERRGREAAAILRRRGALGRRLRPIDRQPIERRPADRPSPP